MGFYQTSENIKLLRNILLDYETAEETTPLEYMKIYIQKCPENIEDAKLSWIAESFLSLQKHAQFLREIANHLSNELTDEEQDYCMIYFNAIIFQIDPKNMQLLYKSIFNVSKALLNTFTDFLSNNEVLSYISQVAQTYYDASYITEKIIGPLFAWQPYISEMAHNYAEYVQKVESRKQKPPTIPVQPNVLNRKGKEAAKVPSQPSFPVTPPNSVHIKGKKMLTKSVIDRRLKNIHEKNKQKADRLLHVVKNNDFHFAQYKSERYIKKISDIKGDIDSTTPLPKPKKIVATSLLPPVRENIATVKRMSNRVQITEQEEIEWLQSLMSCCRNGTKINDIIENNRQERERERLYDIEKKHLMGQISYEEAVLAKKRVIEQNKKRYESFQKERESWNSEIEKWRKSQLAKSRTRVEKLSLIELNILEAKQAVARKNKESASKVKQETEIMIAEAIKQQQEELDRKIKMIKEIKILSLIASKAKVPKIIDLTETSGLGLLCEMSIAELQERMAAMKLGIKEEMERKKSLIKEVNETAKKELEDVKNSIKAFIDERADIRKQAKATIKPSVQLIGETSKEINDLKKVLEEKRKLRIQLSTDRKITL